MSKYIVITEDGKMFPFDPDDWRFMPNKERLERGDYDPKFTQEVDGDKVIVTVTQEMMPLVKVK